MTAAVSPGSRSAWNIGPAVCEEAAAQEGGQRGIKDEYADVIGSIKRLNETIRHQQGIMSPESNGRGHGRLLRTIAANEGISGVELALKMNMAPPVISEKLSGLEKDGMIYRERDQKDRRRTHIYLTNDGTMALARREFGQKRFEECIRECLSEEERAVFCEMCRRIISGIREMEHDPVYTDESLIDFYGQQKAHRLHEKKQIHRESGRNRKSARK